MKITAKTVWKSSRRIEVEVMEGSEKKTLYFESDKALWDGPPATDDFAAVALCQYCSAKKADLFIEGTVTRSALLNLDEFIRIWSNWRPDLFSPTAVRAKNEIKDAPNRGKPAVLAFSGGVGASFSLAAHQTGLLGASGRKIGLGILIAGYDLKAGRKESAGLVYKKTKKALKTFGVPCAMIETNWQRSFCPDPPMGIAAGVACVLETLAGEYSAGILSSNSLNYLQEIKMKPYGSCTMINHLLGSIAFPIVSTGGTHTRIERIRMLKKYPKLILHLRVCERTDGSGSNCGICEKCVLTRLEMRINHISADIFDSPLKPAHIEGLELEDGIAFRLFEDVYLNFLKDDPLYGVIEKKYIEKSCGRDRQASLLNRINAKNGEITFIKAEMDAIRNSKSYKLTAPLRFIRKFF